MNVKLVVEFTGSPIDTMKAVVQIKEGAAKYGIAVTAEALGAPYKKYVSRKVFMRVRDVYMVLEGEDTLVTNAFFDGLMATSH